MKFQPEDLTKRAFDALMALDGPRKLIALAGPPAAGKSTVSRLLSQALRDAGRQAEVVPMDGFHLDNAILSARGLLHRKGAPETFDVAGFGHMLRRIASGEPVVFPVFDRHRDIAIAGAGFLPADVEFVLVEGNYLLLDQEAWSSFASVWDYTIWIDADRDDLAARLMDRWRAEGMSEDDSRRKVEGNDLPNADFSRNHRRAAMLELSATA